MSVGEIVTIDKIEKIVVDSKIPEDECIKNITHKYLSNEKILKFFFGFIYSTASVRKYSLDIFSIQ